MTSQGGQLQQKLNVSIDIVCDVSDMLLQQTSTIPRVRRQDFDSKSRSGSSTLTPNELVTAKKNCRVANLIE